MYIYIYGVASKFGYGSARGDPDVWIGLDHLRFGMDRGYGSACGFRVWIGALHFDSQPYIYICMVVSVNRGTPKSSILMECSLINHPFWGTPVYRNPHITVNIPEDSPRSGFPWISHLPGGPPWPIPI